MVTHVVAGCILCSSRILSLNVGGCDQNIGSRVVTGVEILDGECGEMLMVILVSVWKVAGVLIVKNCSRCSFYGVSVNLWRRADSSAEGSGDGH